MLTPKSYTFASAWAAGMPSNGELVRGMEHARVELASSCGPGLMLRPRSSEFFHACVWLCQLLTVALEQTPDG